MAVPALMAGMALASAMAPFDGGDAFTYDPLSRLLEARVVAPASSGPWASDPALRRVVFASLDWGGRPAQERIGSIELSFRYDVFDNPVALSAAYSGSGGEGAFFSLSRSFDSLNRLTEVTEGSGLLGAVWSWGGRDRLYSLTTRGPLGSTVRFGYIGGAGPQFPKSQDHPASLWRLGTLTWGAGPGAGPTALPSVVWGQWGFGWRVGRSGSEANEALKVGRKVLGEGLLSSMGWSFALDAGQRLAGAFAGAGSLRESESQESFERFRFAYGEGDGLSRMVREGAGEAVGFEVGVGGRITSRGGVAYLYDRSGRRVEDERFSYVWDWRGRLVQVDIKPGSGVRDASGRLLEGHRILYEHDALGRLLHRIHLGPLPQGERDEGKRPFVAKTRFLWEGNNLLAEEGLNFQGGLLWRKSYLSGPQRLDDVVQIKVETFSASDPTTPTSVWVYTVLKDELGSVVGLVEEKAGSRPERPPVLARYLYTPYGEAHGEVGPEVREVRFDSALTAVVTDGGTVTQVVVDEGKAAKGGLRITMALPVDAATLGEGVMVEKLVPGEGWRPLGREEVVVAPTRAPPGHTAEDLPPGLDILALAGWPRGVSFRVRLTQALADLAGRPLAEEQSFVWSIPADASQEVVFHQTFPVSYDSIQAASDTLGGALPGGQTLLFHGLWTDPATGLAYARNRWYDPRTASWLSEDPLRDFDSPNLYAYGAWQPQMYRDPEGLWVETLWDVASVVWDVYELRKDPKSVSNWVALVADVGAAVLPCLPAGAGAALHGGKAGKAVAKALSHADELADAEKALDRLEDTEDALTRLTQGATDAGEVVGAAKAVSKVENVRHATTSADAVQKILKAIDPRFFNPESRFGRAFYDAQEGGTAVAEVQAGGRKATHVIRFHLDVGKAKVLDLTDPAIAKARGYVHDPAADALHRTIANKALEAGYNVIQFESYRVPGTINYAVLRQFDELLIPQMVSPVP